MNGELVIVTVGYKTEEGKAVIKCLCGSALSNEAFIPQPYENDMFDNKDKINSYPKRYFLKIDQYNNSKMNTRVCFTSNVIVGRQKRSSIKF